MSNIAEGYERGSRAEFGRFVSIAKGSCGEVRCQLYVARDQGYIEAAMFEDTCGRAVEISRMLHALNRSLRVRG